MKTVEIIRYTGETKLKEIAGKDETGKDIIQEIEVPDFVVEKSIDCEDHELGSLLYRARLDAENLTLGEQGDYSARVKEAANEEA